MTLEPEAVGLRRRLSHLQRSLEHPSDPLSVTLVRMVIEEIEARLAALAAIGGLIRSSNPSPHCNNSSRNKKRKGAHRCGRIAGPVVSIRLSCSHADAPLAARHTAGRARLHSRTIAVPTENAGKATDGRTVGIV